MPVWCRDRLYTNTIQYKFSFGLARVLQNSEHNHEMFKLGRYTKISVHHCKSQDTTFRTSAGSPGCTTSSTNDCGTRCAGQESTRDRLSDLETDCLTGKQTVSSWVRLSRSMPSKPVKDCGPSVTPHKQARKIVGNLASHLSKNIGPML